MASVVAAELHLAEPEQLTPENQEGAIISEVFTEEVQEHTIKGGVVELAVAWTW